MGGVITWNQSTAITRTVLKEENILMVFCLMCTEMLLLSFACFPDLCSQIPFFSQTQVNILCPFSCNKTENKILLLFECPTYTHPLRSRYTPDWINENDHQKYFVRTMNDKLLESVLNLAKFLFYAFKLRLSKMNMAALSWSVVIRYPLRIESWCA